MKESLFCAASIVAAVAASVGMVYASAVPETHTYAPVLTRMVVLQAALAAYLLARCVQDSRFQQLVRVVAWSCVAAFAFRAALKFHWIARPLSLWPVCFAPFFVPTGVALSSVAIRIEKERPLFVAAFVAISSLHLSLSLGQQPVHVVIDSLCFFLADYLPLSFILTTLHARISSAVRDGRRGEETDRVLPSIEADVDDEVAVEFRATD